VRAPGLPISSKTRILAEDEDELRDHTLFLNYHKDRREEKMSNSERLLRGVTYNGLYVVCKMDKKAEKDGG